MTLDDDAELVWLEPEQLPKPSAKTGTTQETTVQTIEQHLMLLSNSELKEECRRWNLSASGNKTVLFQRLLTIEPTVAGARPSLPSLPKPNVTEAPTMGQRGNPPPAGEMKVSQLMLLSNAALRDLLKQQNQSTNGNKQILIKRLLSEESMRAVPRSRRNNTQEENMEEQLTGFLMVPSPLTEVVAKVTADGLRAPTEPENDAYAPKFYFGETFDHKPFTELCDAFRTVNGKYKMPL